MDNELLPFKNRTPYTVPEGFFEQSKANIWAAIAASETSVAAPETPKVVEMPRRKSRKSLWMRVAASALVVAVVGGLAISQFRSTPSEMAMAKDTTTLSKTPQTIDETAQKVGLYALADDEAEQEAWTDFADDDIFLQQDE